MSRNSEKWELLVETLKFTKAIALCVCLIAGTVLVFQDKTQEATLMFVISLIGMTERREPKDQP